MLPGLERLSLGDATAGFYELTAAERNSESCATSTAGAGAGASEAESRDLLYERARSRRAWMSGDGSLSCIVKRRLRCDHSSRFEP